MRRIRWGNLALAAAGCAAAVFGSAWAFSTTSTTSLPADEPRPLLADAPIPTPEEIAQREDAPAAAATDDARRERARTGDERRGKRKRGDERRPRPRARARKRPRARTQPTRLAVAPTPAPQPVTPAPRRAAPTAPPSGGEFGFEGG